MNNPAISVILPVYNAAATVEEAIRSILVQTFVDFELLVINDGSEDDSEKKILAFNDDRIIYLNNGSNLGLIHSLNLGIEKARGSYIARMDADDISDPERFRIQKDHLDKNAGTDVIASTVKFIDEKGNDKGSWKLDQETTTASSIRKAMPWQNCIAHPSVMMRSNILKEYRYDAAQENIEDYDLWLRLLASGAIIEKVARPLLSYRIHADSVTSTKLRGKNFFFKHIKTKAKFIGKQIRNGKLNGYTLKIALTMGMDMVKGIGKSIKGK